MVPFCRTLDEADRVLALMAGEGLVRGENGLRAYVMAEIPANVVLAEEFAERFDGFSISSNDLTQLTLGVGRDSEVLSRVFDESDPRRGAQHPAPRLPRPGGRPTRRPVRPAPSGDPAFTAILVEAGFDSISVDPDSFVAVKRHVARAEGEQSGRSAGNGPDTRMRTHRRPGGVKKVLLRMGRSALPGCGPVGPCGRSRRHCTVPETARKSGSRETRTRHRPQGTVGPPEPRTGRTR
ncbi:putative PEP-binding protein [Streptomyces sp. NPDC015492]|uniref:putative PEP-binding protein n=1 Tax=Streptomyces sp. NPDC015492 TaxID=3364958 RepID=UPI0036F4B9EC